MAETWVPCYGRHRWETRNGRTACRHCGQTLNPTSTPNTQPQPQVDS